MLISSKTYKLLFHKLNSNLQNKGDLGRDPFNQNFRKFRSNRKSFEKTGPPFGVIYFSRSDRLEFWLNGSRL